jgi:phosphatidylserine/phosphatidylglycerophosphate/cardiolipin synthase-like enzyme
MIPQNHQVSAGIVITGLLELAVVIRIMLRPQRDPAARIAWVLVVAMFPLLGMLAYLLVGEARLGRSRTARFRAVLARMPNVALHTKSVTVDREITLIGSANMDRRSFDLNFENNILLYDQALTADMRQRQQVYISKSQRITKQMVASWRMPRLLWNNTIATLGPVL